ncbi:MAG TPA: hypothetical protein VES97_04975, partial [Solirubrobacteraceae bacterium]|nr:hypothetical protein [Solirubrobacteraceae bacterium]
QTPLASTFYRVTAGGISSTVLFEGVKYALTAGASAGTIQSGQALTFAGTVSPDHVGHVVYLERENAFRGGFHVVDVGTVGPNSTYSISHFVFGSRRVVFRVRVPGDPANQAASSSTFAVEVTPAPFGSLRPQIPGVLPTEGQT